MKPDLSRLDKDLSEVAPAIESALGSSSDPVSARRLNELFRQYMVGTDPVLRVRRIDRLMGVLYEMAASGNIKAIQEIMSRVMGPKPSVGDDGGTVVRLVRAEGAYVPTPASEDVGA